MVDRTPIARCPLQALPSAVVGAALGGGFSAIQGGDVMRGQTSCTPIWPYFGMRVTAVIAGRGSYVGCRNIHIQRTGVRSRRHQGWEAICYRQYARGRDLRRDWSGVHLTRAPVIVCGIMCRCAFRASGCALLAWRCAVSSHEEWYTAICSGPS